MPENADRKARILYVDDLQTNLVLFQATFENDFHVILADSVKKALEIIKEQDVQVLVTDQRMPDMTGTELLEKVAVDFPDIRRFLLTAFTDHDIIVDAVNKGRIHGYINKPIQADEVRLAIQNSLEIYDLRKKNRQIMKALKKANTELMELDSLKSEIIKLISLEIRNPLNRIMGTLHMLKDKIDSQELINVVNILDGSVSRLEDFSSMTEQISILKSPGHKLKEENVRLRRIIEYSLVETREQMKEKSVQLDLQDEQDDLVVRGEFHLLVSCLVNLLRFATDHTPEGKKLTIKTDRKNNRVHCEIIDGGKHYGDLLLKELESHFSGSGQKLNLNLGIELALAQMIMEAHKGSIHFGRTPGDLGSVSMIFNPVIPDAEK